MKKCLFLFLCLFFSVKSIFAFTLFGGPILEKINCDNGYILKINRYYRLAPGVPPTYREEKTFMFETGSSRLIIGTPDVGRWSLGLATNGGTCRITREISTTTCCPTTTVTSTITETISTDYTIYFIGVSLLLFAIYKKKER